MNEKRIKNKKIKTRVIKKINEKEIRTRKFSQWEKRIKKNLTMGRK